MSSQYVPHVELAQHPWLGRAGRRITADAGRGNPHTRNKHEPADEEHEPCGFPHHRPHAARVVEQRAHDRHHRQDGSYEDENVPLEGRDERILGAEGVEDEQGKGRDRNQDQRAREQEDEDEKRAPPGRRGG